MKLTDQKIEQLLVACKNGNQGAQLEVYNRYYKAMYNAAYRIVQTSDDAEDIMQEAFLTAFSKLYSLKDHTSFGVWLKRIVINKSIHHYNKRKKLNETNINNRLYKLKIENDEKVYACEDALRKVKIVMNTLNELKSNYRLGLTLHLIEGYDYDEIATIMNITDANCRTMISRAKDRLRAKLAPLMTS